MQKMILWAIVLFTPLLWTTTTHAIFGLPDVAALAQRVTIIANQGTQIAQSVTQLARMREQFDKLKEQYDHIRQSTLGEIGALTEAFTDLSAAPRPARRHRPRVARGLCEHRRGRARRCARSVQ